MLINNCLQEQKYYFLFIALIPLSFILISCGSQNLQKPKCINPQNSSLIIRWGEIYPDGATQAWQLDAFARLSDISKKSNSDNKNDREIAVISEQELCSLIVIIKNAVIKTQALYAPGDTSRFVEYSIPALNSNFRGLWNKKYENVGSEEFRHVYDSLEAIRISYIKVKK
ncbi:MAG: hypothetical protein QG635_1510 [Bacteroidota bacterium]|nr:hypothetical protein [Bacteroidota bacterium]